MNNKPLTDNRYSELERILLDAMDQAIGGKGKERHADGENFEDQKICVINRWLKGSPIAGPLFQAVKKTVETSRMTPGAAIRELYGAINYLAAGIRLLEEVMEDEVEKTVPEVNAEVRLINHLHDIKAIEHKVLTYVEGEGLFLPGGEPVTDHPDEATAFISPSCGDCFYGNLSPSDMPCRKCIDKPYRPHWTESFAVRYKPEYKSP
jgi:hypothetical protein